MDRKGSTGFKFGLQPVKEGVIEGKKRAVKMPKPEVKEVPVEEVKAEEKAAEGEEKKEEVAQ